MPITAKTNHPYLLLNNQEYQTLNKMIIDNENLAEIDQYIINESLSLLTEHPLKKRLIGKRMLTLSREALRRILYMSYAFRRTNNQEFLQRTVQEIEVLSNFDDWNPSHFLDVAELSMAFAIAYDWLYNNLNKETRQLMVATIQNKCFTPALMSQYGWFYNTESNWNAVCNSGLLYCALSFQSELPHLSKEIINRCIETNPKYLKSYMPDGGFPEGYGYWGYGTIYQALIFDAYIRNLKHQIDFSIYPGFLRTGKFIQFMEAPSQQCFNFGDSYRQANGKIAVWWLAWITSDPTLLYTEKKFINQGKIDFSEMWLLPLVPIFASRIQKYESSSPKENIWVCNGETPVFIYKESWESDSCQYLAVKGGKASSSHAHMDAGSFVYENKGYRWADDLGGVDYTHIENHKINLWDMGQYSNRWEILRMKNQRHNTISIDTAKYDVNGKAKFVKIHKSATKKGVQIDLGACIPQADKIYREIYIDANSCLTIIDSIISDDSSHRWLWTMNTKAIPIIENDSVIQLSHENTSMYVVFNSTVPITINIGDNSPIHKFDQPNDRSSRIGFVTRDTVKGKMRFLTKIVENKPR